MNPIDELHSLTNLFPDSEPLFQRVEHIPSALTPEPYKTMLAHNHHMTVAMEDYHGGPVAVRVLAQRFEEPWYVRQIILDRPARPEQGETTPVPVQFGIVRFNLSFVTPAVRDEILAGQIPLGRVLINHNVLRHIDLGAILEIVAGPGLARALAIPVGSVTYGRLATIFCNRQPAVDLLEISTVLEP